jgi:hypothetical protein
MHCVEQDCLRLLFPKSVEFIGEDCFLKCGSLTSLTFESDSKLSRLETVALSETGLLEIVISEIS